MFFRDCLYTHHVNEFTQIVKTEPRFSPHLHGGYQVSTWTTLYEAISLDHNKRPWLFWSVQTVHVGVPVLYLKGSPQTFLDKQGPLQIDTPSTRFKCWIMPDMICWSGTYMRLGLHALSTANKPVKYYRPIRSIFQMLRGRKAWQLVHMVILAHWFQIDQDPSWILPRRAAIRDPKWPTLKIWIFHIILNKVDTNAFWKYPMKYW